ncbi:MAG TPA: hypothetical protein VLA16_14415 [Ideonella sp.]|nr:hypothetical protein [Ideonella sp.]
MSEDFFAPPPFKPEEGLQRLQRELRGLGLSERGAQFERRGQALVCAMLEDGVLKAALVRQPARTPEWQRRTLSSSAELRDFVAELKTRLARWGDRDE